MKFSKKEKLYCTLVEFDLADSAGIILPAELAVIKPPSVCTTKGVILSGRGPIWLYATLVHFYHATPWVACFDPRLDGGVVVQSHITSRKVGDIVGVQ